jgi:hypothetical protein
MSVVLDSLLAVPGVTQVSGATLAAFVAAGGPCVLFITGDLVQRPEGADVAVVVRELLRGAPSRSLRLGVVDRRDEGAIMQQYGVVVQPALVLIRADGSMQEIIARMRDWQIYEKAFGRLVAGHPETA